MTESDLLKTENISYEGLVEIKALLRMIDSWLSDRGYDKQDVHTEEKTEETKRKLFVRKWPYKKISDYAKSMFDIFITIQNIKDLEVEHHGVKKKIWHAKVDLQILAYLETDYEGSWENKPMYLFFRTLVDKFIHKEYLSEWRKTVKADADKLAREIRSFLNLVSK